MVLIRVSVLTLCSLHEYMYVLLSVVYLTKRAIHYFAKEEEHWREALVRHTAVLSFFSVSSRLVRPHGHIAWFLLQASRQASPVASTRTRAPTSAPRSSPDPPGPPGCRQVRRSAKHSPHATRRVSIITPCNSSLVLCVRSVGPIGRPEQDY